MRGSPPAPRSVWVDVAGVVLLGTILVGSAGYLLVEAEKEARELAVEAAHHRQAPRQNGRLPLLPHLIEAYSQRSVDSERPLRFQRRPRAARPEPSAHAGGLAASVDAPPPARTLTKSRTPIVDAPFAAQWRRRATPSLSGPSAPGAVSPPPEHTAPSIAADPSAGAGTGSADTGTLSNASRAATGWQGEVHELGRHARVLSSTLGQLDREAPAQAKDAASTNRTVGESAAASADPSDRDVPDPPNVPVDDHLHWLVVVGLLWGAWRVS